VTGLPSANGGITHLRFRHVAGPSFQEIAREHSAEFVGARLTFAPQEFARTLAKIAFCAGVYALGLPPLRNSPIRNVIRGTDQDWRHWVGQWNGEEVNSVKGLHAMQVRASGSDVHIVLRLFAQFGAPEYHVVLGSADPEFVNSDAWPWKD
jgi:hypothetical protein